MFFKNHSINIRLVKNHEAAPTTEETTETRVTLEDISNVSKDLLKHVAIAGVAVAGAAVALKTINEVVVIATESHFNRNKED